MKLHVVVFLVFFAATTGRFSAQATDCNDTHASPEANASSQHQWENGSSPVYADATELARTLDERGFKVQCIRRSVEERLFKGQKGAAFITTDRGVFEVWFLPKTETFAGLKVDEKRKNGRFLYSFRGKPQISRTIDSSKQSYFVHSGNLLFHIWGDEQLATGIKNAFRTH